VGKFLAQFIDFDLAQIDPVAFLENVEKEDRQVAATVIGDDPVAAALAAARGRKPDLRAPPEPTIMSPAVGFAAT
jgi:hypothetical protein